MLWGVETNTDDADGTPVATSEIVPERAAIEALLPRFIGVDRAAAAGLLRHQDRRRARLRSSPATARSWRFAPRAVTIHELAVSAHEGTSTTFETRCGKGTYVRAIARDLGRALGCYGHVTALRRTRVGPFVEADSVALDALEEAETAVAALRRVEAGLGELTRILVDRTDAARLRRGQSMLLRGADAPPEGEAYAACSGVVIAIGAVQNGELVPARVFNLPF